MRYFFTFLYCLCHFFVLAQKNQKNYEYIDVRMDKIPDDYAQSLEGISNYINKNFETDSDKIRAVFYWTAQTISYDVNKMFESKFDEKLQDRIARVFKNKKGVCFDYANIFSQLANTVGIKSVVITGYTKWDKINVDNLSHAWNAARIDNKWYLFDPTWGSGYVRNGVFTRHLDNSYFMVIPDSMINTHMPFDYIWQFKEYPITNQEFIEGVYNNHKQRFDYVQEIDRFENLAKVEQLLAIVQRIEKGGLINQHITQAYLHAKTAWRNESERKKGKQYSEIVEQFNRANQLLNDFIYYRNKQFQPLLADAEIKRKIQEPRDLFVKCQEVLLDFEKNLDNAANKSSVINLREAIVKRLENAEMHLQFVNNYLSKPVSARKMMFYNRIVMKPKS